MSIKSKKLRDSARGRDCTLRVPAVCNGNPETVVLCHVSTKLFGSMGGKSNDQFSFFGCSACHNWTDQRLGTPLERAVYLLDAIAETQDIFIREGLIIIK